MAAQIVSRGYVLVRDGSKVSAVVSGPEGQRLQRRFGGKLVSAVGQPFRYAQNRQLRVLVNPAEFVKGL